MNCLKFFCFGVGIFYAFDFYLYSDDLLFAKIDDALWFARPWVYAFALVLIFIAAARNSVVESNVSVSRSVVFYTSAIVLTGFYLLMMSAGGFYFQQFGGEWGEGLFFLCFYLINSVNYSYFFPRIFKHDFVFLSLSYSLKL